MPKWRIISYIWSGFIVGKVYKEPKNCNRRNIVKEIFKRLFTFIIESKSFVIEKEKIRDERDSADQKKVASHCKYLDIIVGEPFESRYKDLSRVCLSLRKAIFLCIKCELTILYPFKKIVV